MNSILDRDDFTIMKRAIFATQVIQSNTSILNSSGCIFAFSMVFQVMHPQMFEPQTYDSRSDLSGGKE